MNHHKYTSIDPPGSYHQSENRDSEWVCLEKIHGANFSIYLTSNCVKCARRNDFISDDEFFYDYQRLINDMSEQLKTLHQRIGDCVVIGELFGGSYCHPDVPVYIGAIKTQKDISYTPDNNFIAFDLRIIYKYLDYDQMAEHFRESGIRYVTPLLRGSYQKCISFSPYFPTTIPKLYGYPELDNNEAEGFILRPVKEMYNQKGKRIIFKIKTKKYQEVSRKTRPVNLQPNVKEDDIFDYINHARMCNVRSHLSDSITRGDLIKAFVEDVLTDYQKDHGEQLHPENLKAKQKLIGQHVMPYTLPYF